MSREQIVAEIKRLASENNGSPPGQEKFEHETGMTTGSWRGKYWLRWSDALAEAGYSPRQMNKALDAETVLLRLAQLTRKLGHFPTYAETRMEREIDKSFPNHGVFDRFGRRDERISALRTFARTNPEYCDIALLLPDEIVGDEAHSEERERSDVTSDGYVYMLKLGKHYKVGKTFSVPRRHREIALELPEKPEVIHTIQTDDPDGIEAYWHRRFKPFATNGEWFELKGEQVKAFKRRKFM